MTIPIMAQYSKTSSHFERLELMLDSKREYLIELDKLWDSNLLFANLIKLAPVSVLSAEDSVELDQEYKLVVVLDKIGFIKRIDFLSIESKE